MTAEEWKAVADWHGKDVERLKNDMEIIAAALGLDDRAQAAEIVAAILRPMRVIIEPLTGLHSVIVELPILPRAGDLIWLPGINEQTRPWKVRQVVIGREPRIKVLVPPGTADDWDHDIEGLKLWPDVDLVHAR